MDALQFDPVAAADAALWVPNVYSAWGGVLHDWCRCSVPRRRWNMYITKGAAAA